MRFMLTDEAPIPKMLPDGKVALIIAGHPDIHVPRDVARRFCGDMLFLIDEWERRPPAPRKTGNICPFERKPPEH